MGNKEIRRIIFPCVLITIIMENEINEAHEAESEAVSEESKEKRVIVVPGEVIVSSEDFLPGEGARREGNDIISNRYGLSEKVGRVVKIIPLSGAFVPRRNNVVLGRVSGFTHNGWLVDIDYAGTAFLPLTEAPRFVNKGDLKSFMGIGDIIAAKIWSANGTSIDLSFKGRGLGKLEGGLIFRMGPSRVPRVIGREGSMITLIKDKTACNITVGQNGWVWIKGNSLEDEIKARKAIEFVSEKVYIEGLTEKVEEWFEKN